MKKIIGLLMAGMLLVSGCDKKAEPEAALTKYSNMALDAGFDTVMTLTGFTETQEQFNDYFAEMKSMFLHYNALFDVYNSYEGINNIKTINDQAGIAPVKVEPEIIEMLKTAKEFYDLSDGEFDVTMGSVLKIWHVYRDRGIELNGQNQPAPVPADEELENARGCSGWDKVEIDEQQSTVYLNSSCTSLDVGGIAKGFAAGKVAQALEAAGLKHGTVDAGGNICTINNKPENKNWVVGIRNPEGNGSLAALSLPGSSAFVSSGDYERFYLGEDGKTYHHIIDPQTLKPADYFHQVTVVTSDSGAADALSTSLFTMSYEDGLALVQRYKQAHPDKPIGVMWVMDKEKQPENAEGTISGEYFITYTSELQQYIVQ